MIEQFYKLARPDGWDFYTGETINYRESIGKIVRRTKIDKVELCSDTCLHASRTPDKCFIGASIPCSVYRVEGNPVIEDDEKAGFKRIRVIEELDPVEVFKWDYALAANPINPLKISAGDLELEKKNMITWVSVWASGGASVWNSVGASVGASVSSSVKNSVGASVWNSVGASVRNSVGASVWNSVWASGGASVWNSVRNSVETSVWDSVRAIVRAYIGYIFRAVVPGWSDDYPYQSAVDLWYAGYVTTFDGETWRLHAGPDAAIVYEFTGR